MVQTNRRSATNKRNTFRWPAPSKPPPKDVESQTPSRNSHPVVGRSRSKITSKRKRARKLLFLAHISRPRGSLVFIWLLKQKYRRASAPSIQNSTVKNAVGQNSLRRRRLPVYVPTSFFYSVDSSRREQGRYMQTKEAIRKIGVSVLWLADVGFDRFWNWRVEWGGLLRQTCLELGDSGEQSTAR